MARYWTGLLTADHSDFSGRRSVAGAGWRAVLGRAPDTQRRPGRGVYIVAHTAGVAQKALDLIWAGLAVVDSLYMPLDEYPELANVRSSFEGHSVPRACVLAARASRGKDTTYALATLAFSKGLASTHYMDLDPVHWRHGPAVTSVPRYHLRFAHAVIAAYAVLEQLGLEVRASSERPSRTGADWNPAVRTDLERRLREAGVDLSESAVWYVRGTPRRTERRRPTVSLGRAQWANRRVRDQEVEVVDAVADLSWLRSHVASHRLRELASSLTHYDVANAQDLARRLLLSRLRLWRQY